MKRFNRGTVILISAIFVFLLRSFASAQGVVVEPERIPVQELKVLLDNTGDVVVVDVRSKASYDFGRIPGAISIPLAEIPDRHEELPRNKTIIFY